MTDQETIRKAREALDRAKKRNQEIKQKIRELRAEMEKENAMILSCLTVLDDIWLKGEQTGRERRERANDNRGGEVKRWI